MSRRAILLVGCSAAPISAPAPEPPLFTVRADSIGALSAKTPATLVALRDAFRGYDVAPVNNESLEFRISKGSDRILDVIPDATGSILNVHVLSPKIEIADHPWRVGAAFSNAELVTACECWGDQTVCFREGEHVAVALAKICREGTFGTIAARKALVGVAIRTTIWSPRPLVVGGYAPPEERADGEPDPP